MCIHYYWSGENGSEAEGYATVYVQKVDTLLHLTLGNFLPQLAF